MREFGRHLVPVVLAVAAISKLKSAPPLKLNHLSITITDHQTINSKVLRIDRAQVNDSGIYECRVAAAVQQRSAQNFEHQHEQLRKLVRLVVNGK